MKLPISKTGFADTDRKFFDVSTGRPDNSYKVVIAYVGIFIVLAFFKSPDIFKHPRFWAEEGTVFYVGFLHLSFIKCIFFIKSGSLQILTNSIVYFSTKVPMMAAPAVTTYMALVFHLIIVVQIVLFIREYELPRPIGVILVLSSALLPQTFEVWLSTTNLQWVMGLSVLLIFAMPSNWIERHWKGAAIWCLVCGLSGVPATILAPIFVVRAALERSPPIAMLSVVLGLAAVIQLAILESVGGEPRPYPTHLLVLFVPLLLQSVLSPVLSADVVDRIGTLILSPNLWIHRLVLIATLVGALGILGVAASAAYSARRQILVWLILLALLFVTCVQNFGAIDPSGQFSGWAGGRYFLFGAVCLCILLAWGTTAQFLYLRILSVGLLCAIVVSGTYTIAFSQWPKGMVHGPSWRRQLKACAEGQNCRVKIWPDGWSFDVSK